MNHDAKLEFLGKLFGRDIYIDMKDCDPRTFEYAKNFLDRIIQDAEAIKRIKEVLMIN